MKKLALFLLLLLIAGAAAGVWFYRGVDRPFKGYGGAEQFVEIPQGAGSIAIANRLAVAGVVHDVNSFRKPPFRSSSSRGDVALAERCPMAKF